MICNLLIKLFGPNWRTSLSSIVTVLFGFIAYKPQYFPHILADIAAFGTAGGMLAFGISARDKRVASAVNAAANQEKP